VQQFSKPILRHFHSKNERLQAIEPEQQRQLRKQRQSLHIRWTPKRGQRGFVLQLCNLDRSYRRRQGRIQLVTGQ
jgi:hypothetical protein